MNVVFIVVVQNVVERLRWDRVIARIVGSHWSGRRRNDMKLLVTWLKKDGSCRFWTNAEKVEQAAMSLVGLRGAVISTHSAHEDGDSNTTQKNQQFFITFPQSNHIIPPQITANLPCTHPKPFSLCSFSGANPPVNSCLLLVRTKLFETSLPPAARSEYQRLFHFNPFTHPNMFNLCSVFISQVVKSKAVRLLINDICQYGF